jgi:hypothetical protein
MVIEGFGFGGEGLGLEQCDARHAATVTGELGCRTQEILGFFISISAQSSVFKAKTPHN